MADILVSKIQVPSLPNDNLILKDAEARNDLSTALATVTGNPLNFSTRSAQKSKETVISLEPIQDLHGYEHPWPAGGGKNKFNKNSRITGGTVTVNGETITIEGSYYASFACSLPAGTYTVSVENVVKGANGYAAFCFRYDGTQETSQLLTFDAPRVVTLNRAVSQIYIYSSGSSTSGTVTYTKIQVEEGSTATSYESYENICPIDGRTETSLVGCGKNRSSINAVSLAKGGIATVTEPVVPIQPGNYKITCTPSGDQGTVRFALLDANQNAIVYSDSINNGTEIDLTLPQTAYYCQVYIGGSFPSGGTFSTNDLMLRPADADPTYEPYQQSNDLTIQFGETVYGATVELEKGTVTVTWETTGLKDLSWTAYPNETNKYSAEIPGRKPGNHFICNVYKTGTTRQTPYSISPYNQYDTTNLIFINDPDCATVQDLITKLTNMNAVLCYELATPYTIQLTPNEISLLSGVNVISTDADGISLTYRDGKVATLGDLDSLNVTISNALEGKVDEVSGKGLSTNDYTDEEKAKVAEIDDKANDDGSYGDMSVGSLLMSNAVKSTDTTPFLFRPIPPLSTPYIREKLVGASMAWNQLAKLTGSGWTFNESLTDLVIDAANRIIKFRSKTASTYGTFKLTVPANHKFFIAFDYTKNGNVTVYLQNGSDSDYSQQISTSGIKSYVKSSSGTFFAFKMANPDAENYYEFKNLQFIDLTLAFNTAIADHIYSMEQAQAGSGIAWIKSYGFLTDDYYTTDAGSVQSVCADRKEIVGFNLWDEEWELGGIDSSGQNETRTDRIRSKNYIPVIPNTNYYSNLSGGYFCYDSNKNFVTSLIRTNEGILSIPDNVRFIRFRSTSNYGATYNHDICINISDTAKNGTYEPYHKTTISLGHDELRGMMQLDAQNNIVYDGDEKTSDGTITRKYIYAEFDGSSDENWSIANTGTENWYYTINTGINNLNYMISNLYEWVSVSNSNTVKGIYITSAGYLRIRENSEDTVANFKTRLASKPLQIVVKLSTPTTEQSTPFTSPQYLFDGGTEEFIDYGVEQQTRDVAVPVGHVTEYMGASDGTEIKDKFYLPTLPQNDGEYLLKIKKQNGVVADMSWGKGGDGVAYLPTIYSTEEREVGVWTDGKPIYQKTITGLSFNTVLDGWANSGASLSNVDKIIKCECGQNVSSMIEICFAKVENSVLYIWTTNRVTYEFNIINILYTKSTDTPGSGTWTPSGEIAQHYSTNEQIIGTWIDGNTFYRKVIDCGALPNATTKYVTLNLPSNLGVICGYKCFAQNAVSFIPIPYVDDYAKTGDILMSIQIDNDRVRFINHSNYSTLNVTLILEYTKTSS